METMPTNACVYFYECKGCGIRLSPKPAFVACSVPMGQPLSADARNWFLLCEMKGGATA